MSKQENESMKSNKQKKQKAKGDQQGKKRHVTKRKYSTFKILYIKICKLNLQQYKLKKEWMHTLVQQQTKFQNVPLFSVGAASDPSSNISFQCPKILQKSVSESCISYYYSTE